MVIKLSFEVLEISFVILKPSNIMSSILQNYKRRNPYYKIAEDEIILLFRRYAIGKRTYIWLFLKKRWT